MIISALCIRDSIGSMQVIVWETAEARLASLQADHRLRWRCWRDTVRRNLLALCGTMWSFQGANVLLEGDWQLEGWTAKSFTLMHD